MVSTQKSYNRVKIFSASRFKDRMTLGETVTKWIEQHPEIEIVDKLVVQSSDSEFHCITIGIFYRV